MSLSNTAVPKYYGRFRDDVIAGRIPICAEIEMEMFRIDDLIANPGVYYDENAVEGFIAFCEEELTLTDGRPLKLLDSFKLWGEQIFGWYYFEERKVHFENIDILATTRSYVFIKVKLIWDPPTSSAISDAFNRSMNEYEWRLNVRAEEEKDNE